ncbi:guanine-1-methyltransferase-domain-containing protein [Tuber borchii]|uniref:tRNA (guanine(9)-N1)-methyltransferase n=1 Tax=Tuber borchii TaxID=42251 RepID=A0A2T6ZHF6_TUBBO|nr:guanine-1-methyltransferase-domain-containing protein [Tuber borchii]
MGEWEGNINSPILTHARILVSPVTLLPLDDQLQPIPMSFSADLPIPTDNTEIPRESPPLPPPPSDSPSAPSTTAPEPTTTTTTTTTPDPQSTTTKLSKNARKRQLKAKHWAETREAWKAAKREKKKVRKAAERAKAKAAAEAAAEAARETGGGSGKQGDNGNKNNGSMNRRRPVLEPITFIMDCGFDDLMADKEITSLSSQLTRTYSVNRTSSRQVTLHLTSLNKRLLTRYQTVLSNQHLRWKNVVVSSEPYEVTPDLVYLTADSPNTITELENGKKYIVGAIVDKNRYKGLCHKKAVAQGVATAKLPIGEYVSMASRFVLTTNQVAEIMIRWLECRDWEKAFLEVIPRRKMPVAKGGGEDEEDGEGEGEQEGEDVGDGWMPVEDGYNSPTPADNLDKAGDKMDGIENAALIDGERGDSQQKNTTSGQAPGAMDKPT